MTNQVQSCDRVNDFRRRKPSGVINGSFQVQFEGLMQSLAADAGLVSHSPWLE